MNEYLINADRRLKQAEFEAYDNDDAKEALACAGRNLEMVSLKVKS